MEWSKEMVSQLIDLYHDGLVLWVITSPNYKNKFNKNDAWSEILNILNIEKSEVEKKMKNCICQFCRYHYI